MDNGINVLYAILLIYISAVLYEKVIWIVSASIQKTSVLY